MEKRYSVQDFMDEYNKLATKSQRETLLNKVRILPYVSYALKQVLAEKIVKATSLDENGNINIRSGMRYIFYVYTIIETYTDIKMSEDNIINDFDLLNEKGLVDEIFKKISEKEIDEFKTVLDMSFNDFMTNYYEPHAFVERNIINIINGIKDILPQVVPILDKVKDMDIDELNNITSVIFPSGKNK